MSGGNSHSKSQVENPLKIEEKKGVKKLIIHADDFGMSEAVNEGVLRCIQEGVVTSTSLLVNFDASRKALDLAKRFSLDVGWHLNLVQGRPLSPPEKIPSLVGPKGEFHPLPVLIRKCLLRTLRAQEVERELKAQLQVFLEHGIHPTHLDGHQHAHVFPVLREAVLKILAVYPIPFVRTPREEGGLRLPRFPARFFLRRMKGARPEFWKSSGAKSLPFYGLSLSTRSGDQRAWEELLRRIKEDEAEVMVHPGFLGTPHEGRSDDFWKRREEELRLLTNPVFKSMIVQKGFQLVSYRDLLQ